MGASVRQVFLGIMGVLLGACQSISNPSILDNSRAEIAANITEVSRGSGPPDARADACYGLQVTPAVIETVTEQIITRPAITDATGAVLRPARYRTETQQVIVTERRERWFETPCDIEDNPEFIAALQRALAVRGHYNGPDNGRLDRPTQDAIRAFQRAQGLDSPILSLPAARQLGLSVWYPELLDRAQDEG